MPTLSTLRSRVREKLQALGVEPDHMPLVLAKVCHLITHLAHDEQAAVLRSRANPADFGKVDDMFALVSEEFQEEIVLIDQEVERLAHERITRSREPLTVKELQAWLEERIETEFTGMPWRQAWRD